MEEMNRRSFIKGTVAAAVAAALPGGDGVALYSAAHPPALVTEHMDGARMAAALARSMMQTKEVITVNILNRSFE